MTNKTVMQKGESIIIVDSETVENHRAEGWTDIFGFRADDPAQWDDLRFPAAGINPPGGGANDPSRDTDDGRLVFVHTVDNIIAIQAQTPHGWQEGGILKPHVHWSPTSTDAGSVHWSMQYKYADPILANGDTPSSAQIFQDDWLTVDAVGISPEVIDAHLITPLGEIDLAGFHVSCMILIILRRLTDDDDTLAASVKLNEFDIHYQADSLGSNVEYIK